MTTHWRARSACLLLLFSSGCTRVYEVEQTREEQQRLLDCLSVHGEWSAPVSGFRCRICLASNDAVETESVDAAFVVSNVGDEPTSIQDWDAPPFSGHWLNWRMDGRPFVGVHPRETCATFYSGRMRMRPGGIAIFGPVCILTPPRPGAHTIVASFKAGDHLLDAPAVQFRVRPALWGEPMNGVRLRIRSPDEPIRSGERSSV